LLGVSGAARIAKARGFKPKLPERWSSNALILRKSSAGGDSGDWERPHLLEGAALERIRLGEPPDETAGRI